MQLIIFSTIFNTSKDLMRQILLKKIGTKKERLPVVSGDPHRQHTLIASRTPGPGRTSPPRRGDRKAAPARGTGLQGFDRGCSN